MTIAKPLLTPKAAAELLGVSLSHLNKISRPGDMQIRPVKIGYRTKRYEQNEIESFIDKRKTA
jgi:predicted DNA-binding transcriptional regulator AlpA